MLSPNYVDQLFATIRVTWGAQKYVSTYGPPAESERDAGEDWTEQVHNLWAHQLSDFPPETIRKAMQAMIDSGREWPPSLPEFKAACRDFRRSEAVENALPAPGHGETDRETARKNIETVKAMLAGSIKRMRT